MNILHIRLQILVGIVFWSSIAALAQEEGKGDAAPEKNKKYHVNADQQSYNTKKDLYVLEGNVVARHRNIELQADYARIHVDTGDVRAEGDITLKQGEKILHGEKVQGNFNTGEFEFGTFKGEAPGGKGTWYSRGQSGEQGKDEILTIQSPSVSTCEYLNDEARFTHYHLKAGKLIEYPDGRFTAYNVWAMLGPVPIFYTPVWYGNRDTGPVSIRPGWDSDLGAFVFLSKGWQLTPDIETTMHADFWSDEGLALGNETIITKPDSRTEFTAYAMDDREPHNLADEDFYRGFDLENKRWRFGVDHRQELMDDLTFRLSIDALSDAVMLEDWYESEFDASPQTETKASLTYRQDRYTLNLQLRKRINDFYTVIEKMPELKLELPRQALGGTGFYYQGTNSIARLERKWREFDDPSYPGWLEDYNTWRADTLHMFYRPFRLPILGNVVPRAGFRFTYYEDSSERRIDRGDLGTMFEADDPDSSGPGAASSVNYDSEGGSRLRAAGELGFEISRKFYHTAPDAYNEFFNIDGYRHVVQPFLNYTYIPEPSESRKHLYFFDRVDWLQEYNFARVGVEQRWQTRREDGIYTFASLNSYADFHFDESEGDGDDLGDLGVTGEFHPNSTLSFDASMRAGMDTQEIKQSSFAATLGSPDIFQTRVRYLYEQETTARPILSMGSTLTDTHGLGWLTEAFNDRTNAVRTGVKFPLNEKTKAFANYTWDFDENEPQSYSCGITRDLHCWMGRLTFASDNEEIRILLAMYLKAYPKKVRLSHEVETVEIEDSQE